MGHTALSQKQRTKRPDGRAISAKKRAAVYKKTAANQTIQDLRVTSKQKGEKKEREVTRSGCVLKPVPGSAGAAKTSEEKLLRALRKKLREIEQLLHKQKEGLDLDAAQLEKIEEMDTIIEEMANVSESIAAKKR